jgi:YbgC/YbaW family acyl-CoA thioester hydrolase
MRSLGEKMSGKEFVFEHRVYLNETNAFGGVVYFANYVKLQGVVREEFFMKTFPMWELIMKEVEEGKVHMITVEEHSKFIRHAFFGDNIIIKLQTANVKRCSFDLRFKMYRNSDQEFIYEGWQTLTFMDYSGDFITIPDLIRDTILSYRASDSEDKRRQAKK